MAICQEARGFYIARCDGDDFWLDKQKLQKQLALLKAANPQARWSNTDFDVYNESGKLVSRAGFQNGFIPLDGYLFEKMLATRGDHGFDLVGRARLDVRGQCRVGPYNVR